MSFEDFVDTHNSSDLSLKFVISTIVEAIKTKLKRKPVFLIDEVAKMWSNKPVETVNVVQAFMR
jgi:hypothetical protein